MATVPESPGTLAKKAAKSTFGPRRGVLSTYAARLVGPGPIGRDVDAIIWAMRVERDVLASTPDPEREYGYGERQLQLLYQRLSLSDHGLPPDDLEKALEALTRLLDRPVEKRQHLRVVLREILPPGYLDRAFRQARDEYRESLAEAEQISKLLADPGLRRKLSQRRSRMKREGRLGTEPALSPTFSPDPSASLKLWASADRPGVTPSGDEAL
jgi:hypothetical protein